MGANKGNMIANICVFLCIALNCIYMFGSWIGGFNWMAWMLAILNLATGPIVLIAYLREVRKGVFADTDEEEEIVE